jgi:hypothetical protein
MSLTRTATTLRPFATARRISRRGRQRPHGQMGERPESPATTAQERPLISLKVDVKTRMRPRPITFREDLLRDLTCTVCACRYGVSRNRVRPTPSRATSRCPALLISAAIRDESAFVNEKGPLRRPFPCFWRLRRANPKRLAHLSPTRPRQSNPRKVSIDLAVSHCDARTSYVAVGGPNQVVRASGSPKSLRSPTQATYPSGRINTALGAVTSPSTGSSHVPPYSASID